MIKLVTIAIILLIPIIYGGHAALSFRTQHKARTIAAANAMADKADVRIGFNPEWGTPRRIGNHLYCPRVYAVNVAVKC